MFAQRFTRNRRYFATSYDQETRNKSKAIGLYMCSVVIGTLGVAYAAVPLYKAFCQATGFGGTTGKVTVEEFRKNKTTPVQGSRVITVRFEATTTDTLDWDFKPQQNEVKVVPGETALAFFTARNNTKDAIVGVASYNLTPLRAGIYFNKIQCFCFDQQRLKPKEEVDMPVFFYIDPDFATDSKMNGVNDMILSYTFFKAR